MTIKDVARYCGVSVSTVSRVLNGHPDVSDAVREKVLAAADALHYVPNKSAQDLARQQADTIGLVVRGADNPFYTPIIHTIESKCEDAGYTMVMRQITTNDDEIEEAAALVNAKRLKGLILLGGRFDYERAQAAAISVPFVCCTFTNHFGDLDRGAFSSVSIDDRAASYQATKMLVDAGHTKIAALLNATEDHSISELRYRGYKRALSEAGIELDPQLTVETGSYGMASARQCVADLLTARPDVTAIFSISDTMAIAAMKAVAEAGLSVPGDISIVAIDGIEMSEYTVPTLTTLCQPQEELGADAVDILLGALRGEGEGRHLRLETSLRVGGTVGAAR